MSSRVKGSIIIWFEFVCEYDRHTSTPLIDLRIERLENFVIVGHEVGGVVKRHMKNTSLIRGRTLHQEELCNTTSVQSHNCTFEFFDTKKRCNGTSQLELYGDKLNQFGAIY